MGDKESLELVGVLDGFPQKAKNTKGDIFWKLKVKSGENTLTLNMNGETEPVFEEGKPYVFYGYSSEYEYKGEKVKSKWVNEYKLSTQQSETKTGTKAVAATFSKVEMINGAQIGNAVTNAVALTVAMIEKGKLDANAENIDTQVKFWFDKVMEAGRTGKWEITEIPF